MTYNISITSNGETFSVEYDNIDDVYQVVNGLGGYYGNDNLVAVSDLPFIAVKFKDIQKLSVSGISRSDLRKYAQDKMAKEQAEKMSAYQAQIGSGAALQGASNLCEAPGVRLI